MDLSFFCSVSLACWEVLFLVLKKQVGSFLNFLVHLYRPRLEWLQLLSASHFSLMCRLKSVVAFLGIILQLIPSCGKENTKVQFCFTARKANSHSGIPFISPPPCPLLANWAFRGLQSDLLQPLFAWRKMQFGDSAAWQLLPLGVCVRSNKRASSERPPPPTPRALP